MPTIAIRLDPALLHNPDADLRYVVADLITSVSDGAAVDDGYDFDSDDRLIIYLTALDLDLALDAVRSVLASQRPLGNDLASAIVAVADPDHCSERSRFRVVLPADGSVGMFPLP